MKGLLFHSLRQLAICCLYPPPLQSTGPTTACSPPWPLLPRGSEQQEETFVSCCYETMPVYYLMRQVVPGADIRYGHREQSPARDNGKAPPVSSLLTFSADTGRGMRGAEHWSRFPGRDKESSQDQLSRPSTSQPHYSFHIPSSAAEEWRSCQVLSRAIYTICVYYRLQISTLLAVCTDREWMEYS